MEPSFDIIVKAPSGNTSDIRLEKASLDWTVLYVKELIRSRHPAKPMPKEQKLVYSGRLLEDLTTLRDCVRDVTVDQVIHLVVSESALSRANSQSSLPENTGLRRRNVAPSTAPASPAAPSAATTAQFSSPTPAAATAASAASAASAPTSVPTSPAAQPYDTTIFTPGTAAAAAAAATPASFVSSPTMASPFASPPFVMSPFSTQQTPQFVPANQMGVQMQMGMPMTPEQYEMWIQYCAQYYAASGYGSGYGSPSSLGGYQGSPQMFNNEAMNGNFEEPQQNLNNANRQDVVPNNGGRFAQAGLGAAQFDGAEDPARPRRPHWFTSLLTLIAKFVLLVSLLGQNTTPVRFYCLCAASFVILLYQSGLIRRGAAAAAPADPPAAPAAAPAAPAAAPAPANRAAPAAAENNDDALANDGNADDREQQEQGQGQVEVVNNAQEEEEEDGGEPRSVLGEVKNLIVAFISSIVPTGPGPEELAAN